MTDEREDVRSNSFLSSAENGQWEGNQIPHDAILVFICAIELRRRRSLSLLELLHLSVQLRPSSA